MSSRKYGPHMNRPVRASDRDTSGVYAKAEDADHFFEARLLPAIEKARSTGQLVRLVDGTWHVNGKPLEV